MKIRIVISQLLICLFFTQCKTKQNHVYLPKITVTAAVKNPAVNPLSGQWKYNSSNIWFSSGLTLRDDGSFAFLSQGCTEQDFTEGKWTGNNGVITLTSYQNYSPIPKANSITISSSKIRSNEKFSFEQIRYEYVTNLPGPNDTTHVYFDKVRLMIKGDVLLCIDRKSCIAGQDFARVKNDLPKF